MHTLDYTSPISVQKHEILTPSMQLGYKNNMHLPKFIENADTFVVILHEKNLLILLMIIIKSLVRLSPSKPVPQLMQHCWEKKKTAQELAKGFFDLCSC